MQGKIRGGPVLTMERGNMSDIAALAGSGINMVNILGRMIFLCQGKEVVYANPSAIAKLEAKIPSHVIGHAFSRFVEPEFTEIIDLGFDAWANEESGVPVKLVALSGQVLDINLTVSRIAEEESGSPLFLVECEDLTKFIRASEEARQREEQIRNILDSVAEAILTMDSDGVILRANPAAGELFGYDSPEILGRLASDLIDETQKRQFSDLMKSTGQSVGRGRVHEFLARKRDGAEFYVTLTISRLTDNHGGQAYTAVIRDITERKRQDDKLRYLAHHDALTGLPNRTLFHDRLAQTMRLAKRHNEQVAVMFIDLDKFKPINDALGHEAGDIVLQTVARRLTSTIRASDTAARVGGDEFVIILSRLDRIESAAHVARKIIACLAGEIEVGGKTCSIGASIGISVFPDDAETPDGLVKCGDDAMYRVKASGRNNFLYYNSDITP